MIFANPITNLQANVMPAQYGGFDLMPMGQISNVAFNSMPIEQVNISNFDINSVFQNGGQLSGNPQTMQLGMPASYPFDLGNLFANLSSNAFYQPQNMNFGFQNPFYNMHLFNFGQYLQSGNKNSQQSVQKSDKKADTQNNSQYSNLKKNTKETESSNTRLDTLYYGTAEDLNKILAKRGVLAGKGQVYIDMQNKYGINAAILASININESGGTSPLARNKNNVGGVKIPGKHDEYKSYAKVEDCIEHIAKFLRSSYIDKGLVTIEQVGAKYCPPKKTSDKKRDTNSLWPAHVTSIYRSFA